MRDGVGMPPSEVCPGLLIIPLSIPTNRSFPMSSPTRTAKMWRVISFELSLPSRSRNWLVSFSSEVVASRVSASSRTLTMMGGRDGSTRIVIGQSGSPAWMSETPSPGKELPRGGERHGWAAPARGPRDFLAPPAFSLLSFQTFSTF
eukprot:scaffold3574_cov121-Isochrysis_galbana.AAC.6